MLDGKSILITGAASGIGRAAAKLFSAYGAKLTLVDVNIDGLKDIAGEIPSAQAAPADVSDPAAIRSAVLRAQAQFGRLDGAFNNAGVEQRGAGMFPLADYPLDDFDRVLSVNVKGVMSAMQAEIPALLAHGGGAIVNTASVLGWLGAPGMGGYSASKHAVIGLTRVAALDYAKAGVRVNAVLPGAVRTPMLTERAFPANPGYEDMVATMHPMGRIGEAAEIAEAAAWLLSDRASFVTGHMLAVDGGFSAL